MVQLQTVGNVETIEMIVVRDKSWTSQPLYIWMYECVCVCVCVCVCPYVWMYVGIQGVPGGKDLTSGECFLGQTITI